MPKSILKKEGTAAADGTAATTTKNVCFGDLVIYEFKNILGDNPAVSEGAPLTIKWKHSSKNVVALEYYEYLRISRPRRRRKDLQVKSAERDTFLLGQGYRLDQIVKAAEETKKIRLQRQASMKGTTWDKFKSAFENSLAMKIIKAQKSADTAAQEPKILTSKSA